MNYSSKYYSFGQIQFIHDLRSKLMLHRRTVQTQLPAALRGYYSWTHLLCPEVPSFSRLWDWAPVWLYTQTVRQTGRQTGRQANSNQRQSECTLDWFCRKDRMKVSIGSCMAVCVCIWTTIDINSSKLLLWQHQCSSVPSRRSFVF